MKTPALIALALATTIALSADSASAQETAAALPTEYGSEVRVVSPGPLWTQNVYYGRLIEADATGFAIQEPKGRVRRFVRGYGSRLQAPVGHFRSKTRALLVALAGAAMAGTTVALIEFGTSDFGCLVCPPQPESHLEQDARKAAIVGGALGAVIGLSTRWTRWRDVKPAHDDATREGGEGDESQSAGWTVSPTLDLRGRGAGLKLRLAW